MNAETGISSLQAQTIISEAVSRAINAVRTMSIWKVVAVNPNQTVNIECCYLELMQSALGELTLPNQSGALRRFTTFDPGVLVDIPYRVVRSGQFRDMVCPAVGDVGIYMPTYDDMRNWFESGLKMALPSVVKMEPMHGTGIWIGYLQNDKDIQPDYPTNNGTRIIKSNRTKITISDPIDEHGQPTGQESIKIEMTGITITVDSSGSITVNAPNAATTLNCNTATVNASSSVTIDTPETQITGNLSVGGTADITGATTVGGALDVTGAATASEFTTVAGIVLGTHAHSGGTLPSGNTGTPVP